MLLVPIAGIYWGWWLGFLENPAIAAFLVTTLFQAIRKKTGVHQYALFWGVLLVVSLVWGVWALTEYVCNFPIWQDQKFFLPMVALGLGIAKLKEWLQMLPYLALLAVVILVWQYAESALNFAYTFSEIGKSSTPETRAGTGYGYATIGLSASFDWFVFKMPGLVLLACVLVVPPNLDAAKDVLRGKGVRNLFS